jgi:hypothetical protein
MAVATIATAQDATPRSDNLPRPKLLEPVFGNPYPELARSVGMHAAGPASVEVSPAAAKAQGSIFEVPGAADLRVAQAQITTTQIPVPVTEAAPGMTYFAPVDISRGGSRFWVEADCLLWWTRGNSVPPLVTSSPPGTPQNQAGVLGFPATTILFGGSSDNGDLRSGGSITFGYWFDDARTCGIEAGFFMLGDRTTQFCAASDGSGILARPFVNATTGQQQSELISFPGLVAGQVIVRDTSSLLGAGAWGRENLFSNPCAIYPYRLDALIGYRYLRLADDLSISEDLVSINPANPNFVPLGTRLSINDRFATENNFNGLDLGLTGEIYSGRWVLGGYARVALGVNIEEVEISGSTRVTVPGLPPVTNTGGLLALSSNIGSRSRDRFAVVPEIGINLGYQLTPRLLVTAGYDFLFWSEVVRAGSQIDTRVNPNLLPPIAGPATGPLQPAAIFHGTSFWAQGISLGLVLRF